MIITVATGFHRRNQYRAECATTFLTENIRTVLKEKKLYQRMSPIFGDKFCKQSWLQHSTQKLKWDENFLLQFSRNPINISDADHRTQKTLWLR